MIEMVKKPKMCIRVHTGHQNNLIAIFQYPTEKKKFKKIVIISQM